MKTAYTVKELIEILAEFPASADIEINGYQGVDIELHKTDNVVSLDNPY